MGAVEIKKKTKTTLARPIKKIPIVESSMFSYFSLVRVNKVVERANFSRSFSISVSFTPMLILRPLIFPHFPFRFPNANTHRASKTHFLELFFYVGCVRLAECIWRYDKLLGIIWNAVENCALSHSYAKIDRPLSKDRFVFLSIRVAAVAVVCCCSLYFNDYHFRKRGNRIVRIAILFSIRSECANHTKSVNCE